jgi:hypothetical protein
MSELTWQNATGADGLKVLAWFEEHIPREKWEHDETLRRAMIDWRKGRRVTFRGLDAYLTRYGRHVSELPEDVWVRLTRDRKSWPVRSTRRVAEITPKVCANPDCDNLVPIVKGGKRRSPKQYAQIKFCSRECGWTAADIGHRTTPTVRSLA